MHTRWCKHGIGEIEDYVEKAIAFGLKEMAITEHVPHRDNLDARRIQWEEFPAFDQALNNAIDKYSDRIHIIKGFECEYYPEAFSDYKVFRDEYGYELLILGQHRSGKNREIDNFAPKGIREMQIYTDEVCAGLETGMFRFLNHPELALQGYAPGWDEACEKIMRQIYAVCEKNDIPIEINANGFWDNRAYPCEKALVVSKEYKLRYLINSDAHIPEHFCGEPVKATEAFAKKMEIQVMDFLELK